jgi:hypothetical protein
MPLILGDWKSAVTVPKEPSRTIVFDLTDCDQSPSVPPQTKVSLVRSTRHDSDVLCSACDNNRS